MHTATIKNGAIAQRYRAYAMGPATRKPTVADHIAMAGKGKEFRPGQRVGYQVEHVVLEGDVGGQSISIGSVDVITRVVFYAGPPEAEEVVGSVDVNAAGTIVVELVEEPKDDPEPIPESELGA